MGKLLTLTETFFTTCKPIVSASRMFLPGFLFILFIAGCKKNTDGPGEKNNESKNIFTIDQSFKPFNIQATHAVLQSDGKIIVAGMYDYKLSVRRLAQDGANDPSFDIDVDKTWLLTSITALAIMPDGKIMLGGEFTVNGQKTHLVRLTSQGALDRTFSFPYFQAASNNTVHIAKVIPTGTDRFFVGGTFSLRTVDGTSYNYLAKITSDGLLDVTFRASLTHCTRVHLLDNGKLFVVGRSYDNVAANRRNEIVRLNSDGSTDLAFHFKETLLGGIGGGYFTALMPQANGKIIVAGGFTAIEDKTIRDGMYDYRQLARLNADGSVDHTFAKSPGGVAEVRALQELPGGKILVGRGWDPWFDNGKTYLHLHDKDGLADEDFDFGINNSIINEILPLSDREYVLAGDFPNTGFLLKVRLK